MKRQSPRPVLRLFLLATLVVLGAMSAHASRAAGIAVTLLAESNRVFQTPLDASPSPDGTVVYFVARTAAGAGGVFRVPARGGAVKTVTAGAPLVAPQGIVVSTDGQTLYVADPAAGPGGAVFAVGLSSSGLQAVPGTAGLQPSALDLVRQGPRDVLYITGVDRTTKRAGVWRVELGAAASPQPLLRGVPLASASGIAVTATGDVFVAGRTGRARQTDVVLRLHDGKRHRVVSGVTLGSPAGLALTLDETTLLISSLARDGTSQVLLVDLATGKTSTFNDVIGTNRNSGGLHRAHHVNSFAWADVQRPGRIYRVDP